MSEGESQTQTSSDIFFDPCIWKRTEIILLSERENNLKYSWLLKISSEIQLEKLQFWKWATDK